MNKKVFYLTDLESWKKNIRYLVHSPISEKIIKIIKENPPEYVYSDDLDWLDDVVSLETGEESNIRELFAGLLVSEYSHIKAFHATRTESTNSFYERGLIPLVHEDIEIKARQIFNNKDFPEISDDKLNKAIEDSRQYEGGKVYFQLNKDFLINPDHGADHYLKYGSEYLQSIAANLSNYSTCYKDKLSNNGEPVIFECDIPLGIIDFEYIKALAGVVLSEIFYEILDECSEKDFILEDRDFSLAITQTLSPSHIVGHQEI
ncbi:MAG: hypothetical protein PHD43_11970 [Methylococcales bacterium]|jgi:hypothetical protein|nr:hypothetical protein [Methylococcales bacterium]